MTVQRNVQPNLQSNAELNDARAFMHEGRFDEARTVLEQIESTEAKTLLREIDYMEADMEHKAADSKLSHETMQRWQQRIEEQKRIMLIAGQSMLTGGPIWAFLIWVRLQFDKEFQLGGLILLALMVTVLGVFLVVRSRKPRKLDYTRLASANPGIARGVGLGATVSVGLGFANLLILRPEQSNAIIWFLILALIGLYVSHYFLRTADFIEKTQLEMRKR